MKSAIISKNRNSNTVLYSISFLCLLLTIGAFALHVHKLLVIPIVVMCALCFVFIPQSIIYCFFFSNFSGYFVFQKSILGLTLTDIMSIVVIFAYLNSWTDFKNHSPVLTKMQNILVMFLVSSLLSILVNIPQMEGKFLIISSWYFLKAAELFMVFFIFSRYTFSPKQTERFITLCLVLSLAQLPIALSQYYIYGSYRAVSGTLTHHHSMIGTFILIPLCFALYRFFKESSKKQKLYNMLFAVIFLVILILSGARSAMVGLGASGLLFCISHFKFKKVYIISLAGVVVLAVLLYLFTPLHIIVDTTFRSQETKTLDLSSASRFVIWKGAVDHFFRAGYLYKLFGVGIGAYQRIQYDLAIWDGQRTIAGAHNNILHVVSEVGIVGLGAFLGYFYFILKTLYQLRSNLLCKSFFFLTIALLFSGVAQETLWFQKAFGSFWLFYNFMLIVVINCHHNGNDQRIRV